MLRTLRPTGTGASAQLDPVGATPNWNCVKEATSDGDTTYVGKATLGDGQEIIALDSYGMADLPTGLLGAIRKVRVHLFAKFQQIAGGYAKSTPRIRLGTIYYAGTETDLTGSYAGTFKEWTVRPSDSAAWTAADVNAAQASPRLRVLDDMTGTPTEGRFTQAWIEVEHVRVFQPTAAPSMAMTAAQPSFRHPGPTGLPARLSAVLDLSRSSSLAIDRVAFNSFPLGLSNVNSLALGLSGFNSFQRDLIEVNTIEGDF